MRVFGSSKVERVPERAGAAGAARTGVADAAESFFSVDLEATDEVSVLRKIVPSSTRAPAPEAAVTLFVYGWENVEPGPLSWAFPSLHAALDAVKTMRNAIEWCIVAGHEWSDIDAARESGAVLIEQNV